MGDAGQRTKQLLFFRSWYSSGVAGINYTQILNGNSVTATESQNDLVFDYDFTVKRMRLATVANAKTGSSTVSFRDDAADVTGAVITITSGTVGEFDSGILSTLVAAGSKLDFKTDTTSAGASLALHWTAAVEAWVLLPA